MTRCNYLFGILFLFLPVLLPAQHLQPGFNAEEYLETLNVDFLHADTPWTRKEPVIPEGTKLVYRSEETGLHNRWDLWIQHDNIAIISIRGTVGNKESWMENFHAGMIPAIGSLRLNDTTVFRYKLARDNNAYVHAGWTLALGSMAADITAHIRECYEKGIRDFIITGHSQGAAICFLLRSYLEYLDEPGFPKNLTFKTYCSAAPKPGNLYYAYDYDYITRNGWGFRVVNTADWVPETPFSLQTTRDFNVPNPFMNVKKGLRKQKLIARLAIGYVYGRMDRSSKRASRRMQRLLGKMLASQVRKSMPGYRPPGFVQSHNYTPAGAPIVLYADSAYHATYHFDGKNIFVHHMYAPYKYLVEAIYLKQ
ncbi:lipase family protein [Chitinophaga tropicalis]|uniref:Lipase family protein n=1 Tax=Chitinophaga tropicalis TaxID=2683588 RepID=A0A7K1U4G2_9BACT|nr:lipase family protein [Chitinophaga tropicalis]MVT09186.1 lipase family protein [Chitinophaga tropicalis]